ncbi:hypothetical protein SAMD00019534_047260, partial [Acytostelium subglobosum LB1]|uniref:hypothetical protein n=1 Tax=Acytostelium subglobosum LB1 TaxID=1410327 RepID=UPI00064493FD
MDSLPVIVLQYIFDQLNEVDSCCLILTCKRYYDKLRVLLARTPIKCYCDDDHHFDPNFNNLTIFHRCNPKYGVYLLRYHMADLPIVLETKGNDNVNVTEASFDQTTTDISIRNTIITLPSHVRSIVNLPVLPVGDKSVHLSLPESITSIVMCDRFNQCLKPGSIPPTVTSFTLGLNYNQSIELGVLPSSMTKLKFVSGSEYNKPFITGALPSSLRSLKLGRAFNQGIMAGVLPESLIKLVFGIDFNEILIPGVLPRKLQSLNLGYYYNHPWSKDVLPHSLTSLVLSEEYTHKLFPTILPPSLTHLSFGPYFDHPLINSDMLPSSLTHLSFRTNYNNLVTQDTTTMFQSVSLELAHPPMIKYVSVRHYHSFPQNSEFGGHLHTLILDSLVHYYDWDCTIHKYLKTDIPNMVYHNSPIKIRQLDTSYFLLINRRSRVLIVTRDQLLIKGAKILYY